MPTSYLGHTGRYHAWSFTDAGIILRETAGDRCAVLLNSKSCPTGGAFLTITIAVIKVMSYLSSPLPYTFILYVSIGEKLRNWS